MGDLVLIGNAAKQGRVVLPAIITGAKKNARTRFLEFFTVYCHEPVREQWAALKLKLSGHFGYFSITGNARALRNFRHPSSVYGGSC
jgi:hypothetical protein